MPQRKHKGDEEEYHNGGGNQITHRYSAKYPNDRGPQNKNGPVPAVLRGCSGLCCCVILGDSLEKRRYTE